MKLCYGTIAHWQWFKIDSFDIFLDAPTLVVGFQYAIGGVLDHLLIAIVRCDAECVSEIFTVCLTSFKERVS